MGTNREVGMGTNREVGMGTNREGWSSEKEAELLSLMKSRPSLLITIDRKPHSGGGRVLTDQQEWAVVEMQGQNVTLSCPLMPNSSQGVLSWYKQGPGQGPELILSYNVTNTSQVRYGMRLDQSRYAILTREGLNLRHHLLQIITTSLPHVRVDRPVTPKVLVLLPAGAQMQRSERVTLACVITGLRSKAVRITWKVNGATGLKKHASSPQVHREPGGTFSAVGLYTVLAHKWSRENMYRCEVTYKGPFYYDKVESSLCRPL
ncbi:unnamed protein product [Leuciscus chuanchicus]